ncbi:MAG: hypothetical protein SFV81_04300 [Pirellulaceae bacterium]|nr:hypothetical protein [Pirellulaceae bacterium]
MLRSIAKWYISRAIDCNQSLPRWVERRLRYDLSLKQFYDQSQRLAARLRSTEAVTVSRFAHGDEAEPLRVATSRSNRSAALFATFAVGLAATALFALMPFFDRADTGNTQDLANKPEANTEEVAGTDAVERIQIDPQRVRDLIANGRNLAKSLKQRSQGVIEPAPDIDLNQLSALVNLDIDQVVKPVSDLGTSYGALLSKLDEQTETENRRLIASGVDAWKYFVHQVPQSAASLAGL